MKILFSVFLLFLCSFHYAHKLAQNVHCGGAPLLLILVVPHIFFMKCVSFTNGMIRESMPVCTGVFHTQLFAPQTHIYPHKQRGLFMDHPVLFISWKYFIIQLPGIIVKLKSCWLMDIYCCLETWSNSTETQHRPGISHPGLQGSYNSPGHPTWHLCVSPYPWNHYLQGGRGFKWITAPRSKEVGTDLWCWIPAWLLLPSFLSPMDEDMAMLVPFKEDRYLIPLTGLV